MNKLKYESPLIESLGSFEALTQAANDGYATDAVFPTDTPKGDLTFS